MMTNATSPTTSVVNSEHEPAEEQEDRVGHPDPAGDVAERHGDDQHAEDELDRAELHRRRAILARGRRGL